MQLSFSSSWDEEKLATTASTPREAHMGQSLSVLALNGRCERFIYVYDDASRETLLDHLRHQAADPSVAVSWTEYHLLAERARRQARESANMQETSGD